MGNDAPRRFKLIRENTSKECAMRALWCYGSDYRMTDFSRIKSRELWCFVNAIGSTVIKLFTLTHMYHSSGYRPLWTQIQRPKQKGDHCLTDEPVNNLMLTSMKGPLVRDSDDVIVNRARDLFGESKTEPKIIKPPYIGSIILKDSSVVLFWR